MNPKNSLRKIRGRKIAVVTGIVAGASLTAGIAVASNWVVGLAGGSAASAQGASITAVNIDAAVPVGTLANQLYPNATGDVTLKITNQNAFPVLISAFTLPSVTNNAAPGYSDSSLGSAVAGCNASGATSSLVTWTGSGAATVSKTILQGGSAAPLIVPAKTGGTNGVMTVTLTNEASMGDAPLACAGLFFKMPSLSAITASSATGTGSTTATATWI